MPHYPSLSDIARKWTLAADRGKGIRLSAAELDILNAAGAGVLLAQAASAYLQDKAIQRRSEAQTE